MTGNANSGWWRNPGWLIQAALLMVSAGAIYGSLSAEISSLKKTVEVFAHQHDEMLAIVHQMNLEIVRLQAFSHAPDCSVSPSTRSGSRDGR